MYLPRSPKSQSNYLGCSHQTTSHYIGLLCLVSIIRNDLTLASPVNGLRSDLNQGENTMSNATAAYWHLLICAKTLRKTFFSELVSIFINNFACELQVLHAWDSFFACDQHFHLVLASSCSRFDKAKAWLGWRWYTTVNITRTTSPFPARHSSGPQICIARCSKRTVRILLRVWKSIRPP